MTNTLLRGNILYRILSMGNVDYYYLGRGCIVDFDFFSVRGLKSCRPIWPGIKLMMGRGQNFVVQVRSAIFGLGLEIFTLKTQNFFPLGQRKSHQVGSKSTQVNLLFTACQKYARIE